MNRVAAVFTAEGLGIDVAAVDADVSALRSLPIHTYHDPAVYEFELEAIFHRSWQYFAPLERLSSPGDVVTGVVGRIPIVVARGQDDTLHGMVNICRHRAYKVVQDDASECKLLRCRYHSWAYALDGRLVAAPDTQNEPDFEKAKYGLKPVSVYTWGAAVFVNPDPNAKPLREVHPLLDRRSEEKGFILDPKRYRLHRHVVMDQASNWKLWYDNGTECYHCPTIHGQSFADAFDTSDGNYSYDLEDRMTSYDFKSSAHCKADGLRSLEYRSFQLYPGCQIIQQDELMILAKITPTGPETCRFSVDYLAEKSADLDRVNRWIELWHQTYAEDGEAAEIQQTNLRSGRAQPFRYVSTREAPTIFINQLIWADYRKHLASPDFGESNFQ